jgi:phosphoglycolate phosphatase
MSTERRRPFDLVIFDLDGTLVDSVPDIAWSLNLALAEAGLPPLPLETVTRCVGDGAAKLVERALPPSQEGRDPAPIDPASILVRFLSAYANHVCVDTRLYPGIVELLDALADRTALRWTRVVQHVPVELRQTEPLVGQIVDRPGRLQRSPWRD